MPLRGFRAEAVMLWDRNPACHDPQVRRLDLEVLRGEPHLAYDGEASDATYRCLVFDKLPEAVKLYHPRTRTSGCADTSDRTKGGGRGNRVPVESRFRRTACMGDRERGTRSEHDRDPAAADCAADRDLTWPGLRSGAGRGCCRSEESRACTHRSDVRSELK